MISTESTNRWPSDRGRIDIFVVARAGWAHRYLVAAVTAVSTVVALVIALTATPIFRAEVVVTDVRDSGGMGRGAAALANQLGGLASLVGMNVGAGDAQQESQAVLYSRRLAEQFLKRYGIPDELAETGSKAPTLWNAVNKFRKNILFLRTDKRTGVTNIAIESRDPNSAARWANDYIALANELIRVRAIENAQNNIAYLNKQIANTNVVEVQRVMYNLIESETKSLMLANARAEYAFTIVDPAVVPEMRVSPKRTMIVVIGALLGLVLGLGAALVRDLFTFRTPN